MREVKGDLWTYPADVRVITTNGVVRANGEAVMGKGCALEARQRYPALAKELGDWLKRHGKNEAQLWAKYELITFPTKDDWGQPSRISLIVRSAKRLVEIADSCFQPDTIFALPRPGCGCGSLNWRDVKPILAPILDDRFHVISKNKE